MFLRDLLEPMHLLVILAVYLLFFGTRKLPELGKNLGEGIIGLRDAFREAGKAANSPTSEESKTGAELPPKV